MMTLVFDMDDCLFSRSTPFAKACEDVFSSRFVLDWNQLYKIRCYYADEVLEASQTGQMSLEDSHYYRLSKALHDFGHETTQEEVKLFEERYNYHQSHIILDPPFDKLLAELKEMGIPMAVMTNGPSEHQRNKMRALHLDEYIDPSRWIVSGDHGIIKPYVEIYRELEEACGCKPEETWMIGDNYVSDITGAINAGWHSVWYNHRHDEMGDIAPDYIVYTAQEVADVIMEIVKKEA